MCMSRNEDNKKLAQHAEGPCWRLRVWRRARRGRRSPALNIKCGCCDNSLVIYYDESHADLEINGVYSSVSEWRQVLLPLLQESKGRLKTSTRRKKERG